MARGVAVLHFSTDYVFAGNAERPYGEMDPTAPLNAYGRSKRIGEVGLSDSGGRPLILRTQWLYGVHGKSFPRTMWDRALQGLPTRVVTDQIGKPTHTADLAAAAWQLVERDARGTYHVANAGEASWFDVASIVFQSLGATSSLTPCVTADYPTPARRPAYSALSTETVARDHGVILPLWTDALERFLGTLKV